MSTPSSRRRPAPGCRRSAASDSSAADAPPRTPTTRARRDHRPDPAGHPAARAGGAGAAAAPAGQGAGRTRRSGPAAALGRDGPLAGAAAGRRRQPRRTARARGRAGRAAPSSGSGGLGRRRGPRRLRRPRGRVTVVVVAHRASCPSAHARARLPGASRRGVGRRAGRRGRHGAAPALGGTRLVGRRRRSIGRRVRGRRRRARARPTTAAPTAPPPRRPARRCGAAVAVGRRDGGQHVGRRRGAAEQRALEVVGGRACAPQDRPASRVLTQPSRSTRSRQAWQAWTWAQARSPPRRRQLAVEQRADPRAEVADHDSAPPTARPGRGPE